MYIYISIEYFLLHVSAVELHLQGVTQINTNIQENKNIAVDGMTCNSYNKISKCNDIKIIIKYVLILMQDMNDIKIFNAQ